MVIDLKQVVWVSSRNPYPFKIKEGSDPTLLGGRYQKDALIMHISLLLIYQRAVAIMTQV